MNQISKKDVKYLFDAILSLDNLEQCEAFFEDVCTIKEIYSMAQRFTVAKLLKNRKTFNEIVEETGASSATISRVNRALNYGKGYKAILEKQK